MRTATNVGKYKNPKCLEVCNSISPTTTRPRRQHRRQPTVQQRYYKYSKLIRSQLRTHHQPQRKISKLTRKPMKKLTLHFEPHHYKDVTTAHRAQRATKTRCQRTAAAYSNLRQFCTKVKQLRYSPPLFSSHSCANQLLRPQTMPYSRAVR